MDMYLEGHPDSKQLFEMLQRLSETTVSLLDYLDNETFELFRHIYKRRLYKSRDVRRTLRAVVMREEDKVGRMVCRMFCKRSVMFQDFPLKLAFMKSFMRFRRFFVDGDSVEYRMQKLLYRHRCLREDVIKEVEDEILNLPTERMPLYLNFFGSAVGADTVVRILDDVNVQLKPFVASFLPGKERYDWVSRAIVESSPSDKVVIISSMNDVDATQFYRSLSQVYMARAARDRRSFREFVDIMKMVNVDRESKVKIICGWMRVFMYLRQLDDFVRLFEQTRKLDVGGGEYEVLRSFYNAICEYKRTGNLRLAEVLAKCNGEENNPFSIYRWREIYEVYKE